MFKIVLCDDNRETVKQYAKLISKFAEKHKIQIELSYYFSGETLLFNFYDAPNQADIIYLDIIMDKTDGMKTAQQLRKLGCHAQIVFLTSCDDYVYDAFEVNAVQYLLKSELDEEKFENVFLRAVKLALKKEDEMFVYEFDGIKNAVSIKTISYFEILKRVVIMHFENGETDKFYGTMEKLEELFKNKNFIRIHRSYMVHLPYIAELHNKKLILKTGETIPVGITYIESLQKRFSDYIFSSNVYYYGGGIKVE